MTALEEMETMAANSVSVDVITMVLRSHYSDDEIAQAYDELLARGWQVHVERGVTTFYIDGRD